MTVRLSTILLVFLAILATVVGAVNFGFGNGLVLGALALAGGIVGTVLATHEHGFSDWHPAWVSLVGTVALTVVVWFSGTVVAAIALSPLDFGGDTLYGAWMSAHVGIIAAAIAVTIGFSSGWATWFNLTEGGDRLTFRLI